MDPAEQEVTNTTAEKKEEHVSDPAESNAEQNGEAAKSFVDVCVEVIQNDKVQPDFLPNETSEAVTPVESAAQPVRNTTAEKKEECSTPADQSKVECNEETAEVSTAVDVEVTQNGGTQPILSEKTEAVSHMEPDEQIVSNTDSENKEENADAEVEHNEEAEKNLVDACVEEVIQNVEIPSAFLTNEKTEAGCPVESAEQHIAEEKKEEYAKTPANIEYNKGLAEASAVAPVEASVAKTSAEAGTEESKEAAEVPAVFTLELKPEVEPSSETEPTDVTNQPAGVESTAHQAEGSSEKCPAEKYTEETVEAVAVVVEESLPETLAVTNAAAAQEAASKDSREPVPDLLADTVSESPTQPTTETAVKSVESAAPAQPAPNTRAEEESKSEVQTAEDTAVQSVPETPAEHTVELRIEDAIEPATASDAEAVQDKSDIRAIKLTDGLDVEAPTAEADLEPEEDPKQSHSEKMRPNQKSDDANE